MRTLTAAMTRARRSTGAQACTAANDGTMNSPPATARPQKATSSASPAGEASSAAGPTGSAPGEITEAMEAIASANSPISSAPIGTSARFGRPWLARAASTEPTAMPTVKTARQSVTTPFAAADDCP